jgi:hypothetical protein
MPSQFVLREVRVRPTGFMIRFRDIPDLYIWAAYVSFSRWGFEGMIYSACLRDEVDTRRVDEE